MKNEQKQQQRQQLKQDFNLLDETIKGHAISFLAQLPADGSLVMQIRPLIKDKTRAQLGAIFGLWVKEEAERMGESEKHVARKWKAWFLARIYVIEPANAIQAQWVELLAIYMEQQARPDAPEAYKARYIRHAKRISLSWANLEQTKEYMRAIEQHYQDEGRPLTIPDPQYRKYVKPRRQHEKNTD